MSRGTILKQGRTHDSRWLRCATCSLQGGAAAALWKHSEAASAGQDSITCRWQATTSASVISAGSQQVGVRITICSRKQSCWAVDCESSQIGAV